MANIIKNLRGFVCDEREKNWSKEFLSFELQKHKDSTTLDHSDLSVTTKKLADHCVTEEKLSEEIQENLLSMSSNITNLGISAANDINSIKEALSLKADKDTSLAGYGIADAYTKNETYSKTEANTLFEPKADYPINAQLYSSTDSDGNVSYIISCNATANELRKAYNSDKNLRLILSESENPKMRYLSYDSYELGGYPTFSARYDDTSTIIAGLTPEGWYVKVVDAYTKSDIDNLILGSWEAQV